MYIISLFCILPFVSLNVCSDLLDNEYLGSGAERNSLVKKNTLLADPSTDGLRSTASIDYGTALRSVQSTDIESERTLRTLRGAVAVSAGRQESSS